MYIYVDWDDDNPSAELDIQGEQYERLIDICFHHCSYFSLNENRSGVMFDLPEKELEVWLEQLSSPIRKKHLFFCSYEAKQYLLRKVNSLFSWITWGTHNRDIKEGILPEDLCFYRSDGSVFLWSETHEGICVICSKPEEDVSDIVSSEGWREVFDGDYFGVPVHLEEYNLFGNCRYFL